MKSPRHDPYLHNPNMAENNQPIPSQHELPPMSYSEDGRMMQPFPFPPMMLPPQQIDDQTPTDLRVMAAKNPCPCVNDEPQNLACRPKENEESDSDTEIDLTSHSSRDDDLRESERLASRIATSIFRSDTVLHDLIPNDLSLGASKNTDRSISRNNGAL